MPQQWLYRSSTRRDHRYVPPGVMLVWDRDRPRIETFRIDRRGLVLGRDLIQNTEDDRISRAHLRISVEDGLVAATDLGSRNGSYVAGHELVRRRVDVEMPAILRTGRTVWVV